MTADQLVLGLIAEECAELAHRASKAQRFGLGEVQPGQEKNNAERLMEEYLDVVAVMEMLTRLRPDLTRVHDDETIEAMVRRKFEKVLKFSTISLELGRIDKRTLEFIELIAGE